MDLLKKTYEIESINKENDFLKNKNKVLEDENIKLKANEENSENEKWLKNALKFENNKESSLNLLFNE